MKYMYKLIEKIKRILFKELTKKIEDQSLAIGKLLTHQVKLYSNIKDLSEVEFGIFSQWGEDGIIQFLINKIPIENKVFVEFGVENYVESNTRFLLMNNNWSGFIIDGSYENIQNIRSSSLYWKYDIVAKNYFITKDNINSIILEYLKESKLSKNIGLLSIDLDGIDYYVLDNIECISPAIIICEYNWIFGNKDEVVIPYDENFNRTQAHYSNLYWGASLPALYKKAQEKGYEYVGCTSAGNDAFFVKSDFAKSYIGNLITDPENYFFEQKAKESRDQDGKLSFVRGADRKKIIKNKELIDIKSGNLIKCKDIMN